LPILEQMEQMLRPLRLYSLSPESRVHAELCAYAQGLEAAAQRVDRLTQAAFIQTAPTEQLSVWERILGLHQEDAALPERRAGILARLSLGPPGFTREETEGLLHRAGFSGSLEEDFTAATLRLRFGNGASDLASCAPAVHAIEQSLPAQLKIWADLPAKNWDALDAAATAFDSWDALSLRWELQEDDES